MKPAALLRLVPCGSNTGTLDLALLGHGTDSTGRLLGSRRPPLFKAVLRPRYASKRLLYRCRPGDSPAPFAAVSRSWLQWRLSGNAVSILLFVCGAPPGELPITPRRPLLPEAHNSAGQRRSRPHNRRALATARKPVLVLSPSADDGPNHAICKEPGEPPLMRCVLPCRRRGFRPGERAARALSAMGSTSSADASLSNRISWHAVSTPGACRHGG